MELALELHPAHPVVLIMPCVGPPDHTEDICLIRHCNVSFSYGMAIEISFTKQSEPGDLLYFCLDLQSSKASEQDRKIRICELREWKLGCYNKEMWDITGQSRTAMMLPEEWTGMFVFRIFYYFWTSSILFTVCIDVYWLWKDETQCSISRFTTVVTEMSYYFLLSAVR